MNPVYISRCEKAAIYNRQDSSHPSYNRFRHLLSGTIQTRASRLKNSFFPQAVRTAGLTVRTSTERMVYTSPIVH